MKDAVGPHLATLQDWDSRDVRSAVAGVVAVIGAVLLPRWVRLRWLRRFPEIRGVDFK